MNAGPKELNEGFVRSLPDNGPVVMVNLLRFKKESADGDGSGWDAYSRYSKAIPPLLKSVGGTILWAGDVEGAAYGALVIGFGFDKISHSAQFCALGGDVIALGKDDVINR